MKPKALLMALAVVVCATTASAGSANTFLPDAKASALRAAAVLIRATGAIANCDPGMTCRFNALANYATCLGNASSAYSTCIEKCSTANIALIRRCVRKCSQQNTSDVNACESTFDAEMGACGDDDGGGYG